MTDYIKMYENTNRPKFETEEIDRLIRNLRWNATYTNGIIRWKSNNSVPPQEIVEFAAHLGYPVNTGASKAVREYEMDQFITEYRKNYSGPSAEERAEARAVHGPGVTLVNAITGDSWVT